MEMHNSEFECGVCCGFRMNVRVAHECEGDTIDRSNKIENIKRPSMNKKSGYDVTRPLG